MIKINLQLFSDAGEKTEKPTSKRREKAREEGQVAKSMEINSAFLFIFMFMTLHVSGSYLYRNVLDLFKNVYSVYFHKRDIYTVRLMNRLFLEISISMIKILIPIFIVSFILGLIVNILQIGWKVTWKPLKPNFKRINPLSGFKKMFSLRSIVELVKSILKLVIIGSVVYGFIHEQIKNIKGLLNMNYEQVLSYTGNIVVSMALRIGVIYIFIAALDYAYQRYEHEKSLKMTKQEIKEEYKQAEGDPQIKAKIKQKQREISMRRMMQDVPKADVVITNPTHFAVAVMYKADGENAPIVLAKGQDYMAKRIREIAKEHKIQIVENKPLARTLYSTTEIGQEIPPDLYQAVAEILAYVYSLKNS